MYVRLWLSSNGSENLQLASPLSTFVFPTSRITKVAECCLTVKAVNPTTSMNLSIKSTHLVQTLLAIATCT